MALINSHDSPRPSVCPKMGVVKTFIIIIDILWAPGNYSLLKFKCPTEDALIDQFTAATKHYKLYTEHGESCAIERKSDSQIVHFLIVSYFY